MKRKNTNTCYFPAFEFHIERKLRHQYKIDEALLSTNGKVIFTDFNAARVFAHKINAQRNPNLHIYPGELNATGLMEEIFHYVFREYEKQVNPKVFSKAEKYLISVFGEKKLHQILYDFNDKFPATEIYKGKISISKYLIQTTQNRPNKHITLEELIMLYFSNFNTAHKKLLELFDVNHLDDPDAFHLLIDELEDFFETQPGFGPDKQDIFNLFKTPILSAPNDVSKQLDYIMENWESLLPDKIIILLLKSKDLLKEDIHFDNQQEGAGTPTLAPKYKGMEEDLSMFALGKSGYRYAEDSLKEYEEPEQFTPDVHWMPSVVMLAKNTYVWLDQLSKKYHREIRKLDQIPDEELDLIKEWNFTGLWLIGIWERSEASKRIKHIMGNTDAVSSAYSLYDYQIAHDLGGEQAYDNLNQRARSRGIRLASDMVPNHTGVFSKWVLENPDYFIQASFPPFPGYRFHGENLSLHPDIEIRIEDGYFTKTDASVVFQRIDKRNNEVRYIYHGNDGTAMPWNDTAQLDMLKQEVREAVIQKIFEVARRFSIIRFDAAMTLAKKHFSRLWYPRPGTGGDIPSRADYAMSKKQFDDLFPVEFWREVVDRINEKMPETLLLAEAFWFMEGYFVRTLGMHRVYNSAFMHMLKNEENEKYRDLITNTLEFEPEILKRYVNFMSNPDEETAIRQFGTDDKYFGICVLMNTLPGLPMFAHGQIEGYTEKYGMEYQRAYYNELPHQWLVEKHEREIFPLTKKRYLFSDVVNFNIFDFIDSYGNINENVFAYTNSFQNERTLVVFNNKYEQAQGRIHFSAPKLTNTSKGKESISIGLAQALKIDGSKEVYYAIKEHISGLEYLKTGREIYENGMHWSLNGFEYKVYWQFRELHDPNGELEKLYWKLGGSGVSSIERAAGELRLQPIHEAFGELFSEDIIDFLVKGIINKKRSVSQKLGYTLMKSRYESFTEKVSKQLNLDINPVNLANDFILRIKTIESAFDFIHLKEVGLRDFLSNYGYSSLDDILTIGSKATYRENITLLLAYFALETLQQVNTTSEEKDSWADVLKLHWPLQNILIKTGRGKSNVIRDINLINILQKNKEGAFNFVELSGVDPNTKEYEKRQKAILKNIIKTAKGMLGDEFVRNFAGVNAYENIWYYSKDSYEELLAWLFTIPVLEYFSENRQQASNDYEPLIKESIKLYVCAKELSGATSYKVEKLKEEILKNLSA